MQEEASTENGEIDDKVNGWMFSTLTLFQIFRTKPIQILVLFGNVHTRGMSRKVVSVRICHQ